MLRTNDYKEIIMMMKDLIREKNLSDNFIISIDGPCGGGKTTLAEYIKKECDYNIVHMDDFYLPFQKRDKNWMNIIAGHMDFDRLIKDILEPYASGKEINYVSYDCHSDEYLKKKDIDLKKPLVLEGSYTSHPRISEYVDIKIYVNIDERMQIERLTKRNEKVVDKFVSMWIPFENNYFKELSVKEKSDIVYRNIDYYGNRIILASKSARRKELLQNEGYDFDIYVPAKEEKSIIGKKYSLELVENCAMDKAKNAYEELKEKYIEDCGLSQIEKYNPLIISCDTVVVIDDLILGKPKDKADAIRILKSLSSKTHQVVSAVAVIKDGKETKACDVSRVTFKKLTDGEIEEYVERSRPYDKAGSYGIQDEGFSFVESLEGNIDNVIGFPMKVLKEIL